ncbi:DUF805 domain-containing protein [Metakosakonia massiliensis]|uniref:Inner membrane protein YhaH n=1 Tax=Phytobacter massiliensis TaxID=1485952 RepID=A0A6N2YD67_9ENTR|nr:DUF805 domain-containing protein [Phytobacter massiliensis]
MDWYFKVLRHYARFNGRAHRREFWMFMLVNIILSGVLMVVDAIIGWQRVAGVGILSLIYVLLVFIPSLAVQSRRLHDTNRSAKWLWLWCIPLLGWIMLLSYWSQHGTPAENRFGLEPKTFP